MLYVEYDCARVCLCVGLCVCVCMCVCVLFGNMVLFAMEVYSLPLFHTGTLVSLPPTAVDCAAKHVDS